MRPEAERSLWKKKQDKSISCTMFSVGTCRSAIWSKSLILVPLFVVRTSGFNQATLIWLVRFASNYRWGSIMEISTDCTAMGHEVSRKGQTNDIFLCRWSAASSPTSYASSSTLRASTLMEWSCSNSMSFRNGPDWRERSFTLLVSSVTDELPYLVVSESWVNQESSLFRQRCYFSRACLF